MLEKECLKKKFALSAIEKLRKSLIFVNTVVPL
jgi:hypothetical protein